MPKQTVDINENGATRLMAALAGQEVRDVLEGKGDVELAKRSLQLLLEIIAGAVPNMPTSDIKELAKPAHNNARDATAEQTLCSTCYYMVVETSEVPPCRNCRTIRSLWRSAAAPVA